jgi:hypothetical protein
MIQKMRYQTGLVVSGKHNYITIKMEVFIGVCNLFLICFLNNQLFILWTQRQ